MGSSLIKWNYKSYSQKSNTKIVNSILAGALLFDCKNGGFLSDNSESDVIKYL